jgi:hypothetical protein
MLGSRATTVSMLVLSGLCISALICDAPATGQVAQPAEKLGPQQHQHSHHHLHIPMGEEKCELTFSGF